jgi:hypothetical protein
MQTIFAAVLLVMCIAPLTMAQVPDPLMDWSLWEQYRGTVSHPAGAIKRADVERARANIERYDWAKKYRDSVVQRADDWYMARLTPEFIITMLPETTPGEILFTACPACRDQEQPKRHPHGDWDWNWDTPEQATCNICGTVFPNDAYPESVVIETTWGKPQTHTYFGGEPLVLFSYKTARTSVSGHIRARKVSQMATAVERLGEAYALTGDPRYAVATRDILLRFAEVYPYWLLHSGYGEIADMDPRIAAANILNLPEPEKVVPPNNPDHKLHTGFWTAGRSRAVGMGGIFARTVAAGYDMTCEATDENGEPIYSDAQRITIERDVLLESTIHLVAGKIIDNKAVTNRTAAALVGMIVGHPQLVRFGLEGFTETIDGWFLSDGYTPESAAYATMTLGGIIPMGQAMKGYSDPPGYTDASGKRYDDLDLYHDTAYDAAWEGMYNTLQGDLKYPPFADSYAGSGLSAFFVEYMAINYPERPHYLALLKALAGDDLASGTPQTALYYRPPGMEDWPTPPLALPDVCPPDLRIGFMRTGALGRESLLLLNASHWGSHHQYDSLNLYYWKQGRELLTDLGYLWDHPDKHYLVRTVAHHTVVIDGKDQSKAGRGGEVHFFQTSDHVKAMRASSNAYPQTSLYQRTSAIIDHGEERNYVVDFFDVEGGATQDFVYHGMNNDYAIVGADPQATDDALYDFTDARRIGSEPWRIAWKVDEDMTFTAHNLPAAGETGTIATGWGQRDHRGSDLGATIPYIVRHTTGEGRKRFVTVFEAHAPGDPLVQSVILREDGVLIVQTVHGRDTITCTDEQGLAVSSERDGQVTFTFGETAPTQ